MLLSLGIFFFALQKFGRQQTYGSPSIAESFTTVDNALFRTLPGAKMFCRKAMLSHCTKPKGCFRSLCACEFQDRRQSELAGLVALVQGKQMDLVVTGQRPRCGILTAEMRNSAEATTMD